ncbi:hypothetical protein [Dyadobacter sp. NIV53]|uniref:hypothetical protein n=1 Tax=Dyadobacter sp. NIV53 TaxID=2861765 RepID=UPI001C882E65|nr:hypothetical protein [Dyadobacter sp. NIV53]
MYKESVIAISKKARSTFIMLFFLIFSCALFSCDNPENEQDQVKKYFDLKGFIESQINIMDQDKPVVFKTMGIGEEQNERSSKEINWKREFELFIQADINKPAYSQSYIITRPDSMTYEYQIKQGQDLPVKSLRIKLDAPGGMPIQIVAQLKSVNKLYQSEKNIEISCDVKNKNSRIKSYQITGFQKLVTMEKKPFMIKAIINY